jgi:hypothetical protein
VGCDRRLADPRIAAGSDDKRLTGPSSQPYDRQGTREQEARIDMVGSIAAD